MRRFVLFFCFAIIAFSFPVGAKGVLLPQNDGGSASGLGLIPQSETPPETAAPQKTDNSEETPTTEQILSRGLSHTATSPTAASTLSGVSAEPSLGSDLVQTNSNISKLEMSQPLTPGGSVAGDARRKAALAQRIASGKFSPYQDNSFGAEARAKEAEIRKKYERDPVIMDEFAVSSPMKGDKSIIVGVSQTYQWSAQDVRTIERALGYNADEIPKVCQLRIDATAETDVSRFFFKGMVLAGTKTSLEYAGNLQAVTVQPIALCKIPKTLPRTGMVIMKVGNYYSTMLIGQKTCPYDSMKLKKIPRTLLVRYGGESDQTACIFE